MLSTKEKVAHDITNMCSRKINDRHWQQECLAILTTTYNMPEDKACDLLSLRVLAENENDFVLFCLLNVVRPDLVKKHFTETEINTYSKEKFNIDKIKFPIKWKMLELNDSHWVGTISVKELMKLRDAQLINYNENAQRTLRKVVNGGAEYYQIYLNKNAVNGIMESYRNETYIPNTITLNIPEDTEFFYDGNNLIIKEIKAFDILDGYHRYIAMSNIYNENKDFDYQMELRVVCFPEDIARQFIWQEDQKTKMAKVDSDSFNINSPSNQVVQMLNQKGILAGTISRNDGVIDAATLGSIIKILYFNTRKTITRKDMIQVRDELYDKFMDLLDCDASILENKWDTKFTIVAIYIFHLNNIYGNEMLDMINKLYKAAVEETNSEYLFNRDVTPKQLRRLDKIYENIIEGGSNYV